MESSVQESRWAALAGGTRTNQKSLILCADAFAQIFDKVPLTENVKHARNAAESAICVSKLRVPGEHGVKGMSTMLKLERKAPRGQRKTRKNKKIHLLENLRGAEPSVYEDAGDRMYSNGSLYRSICAWKGVEVPDHPCGQGRGSQTPERSMGNS